MSRDTISEVLWSGEEISSPSIGARYLRDVLDKHLEKRPRMEDSLKLTGFKTLTLSLERPATEKDRLKDDLADIKVLLTNGAIPADIMRALTALEARVEKLT